jgi:hypothetical protein
VKYVVIQLVVIEFKLKMSVKKNISNFPKLFLKLFGYVVVAYRYREMRYFITHASTVPRRMMPESTD